MLCLVLEMIFPFIGESVKQGHNLEYFTVTPENCLFGGLKKKMYLQMVWALKSVGI